MDKNNAQPLRKVREGQGVGDRSNRPVQPQGPKVTGYVAIDIDDTMARTGMKIARALSSRSAHKVHWIDWTSYSLKEMYPDLTSAIIQETLVTEVDYERLELTSEVWHHVLNVLTTSGLTPLLVTSRQQVFGDRAHEVTMNWVRYIGLDSQIKPEQVIITKLGAGKANVLQDLGYDIVGSIDDHLDEVVKYNYAFPGAHNALCRTWGNLHSLTNHPDRKSFDVAYEYEDLHMFGNSVVAQFRMNNGFPGAGPKWYRDAPKGEWIFVNSGKPQQGE